MSERKSRWKVAVYAIVFIPIVYWMSAAPTLWVWNQYSMTHHSSGYVNINQPPEWWGTIYAPVLWAIPPRQSLWIRRGDTHLMFYLASPITIILLVLVIGLIVGSVVGRRAGGRYRLGIVGGVFGSIVGSIIGFVVGVVVEVAGWPDRNGWVPEAQDEPPSGSNTY